MNIRLDLHPDTLIALITVWQTSMAEIRHFLVHDERLPDRTRRAVQFLDGLRHQMVSATWMSCDIRCIGCDIRW